jgi:hypothetical protein
MSELKFQTKNFQFSEALKKALNIKIDLFYFRINHIKLYFYVSFNKL